MSELDQTRMALARALWAAQLYRINDHDLARRVMDGDADSHPAIAAVLAALCVAAGDSKPDIKTVVRQALDQATDTMAQELASTYRCPATSRREAAVTKLFAMGWKWHDVRKEWIAPPFAGGGWHP